jgi:adenylate cyclase
MFTVSYSDAAGTSHRVPLDEGETLIGRATNCHIILNVASVSRHHARLRVTGDRCTLSDAGSTYGTHLNGVSLTSETPLKAGDTFHCGAVAFTFEQIVSAPPLLADNHELLQDSASIVLRIDDAALGLVQEGRTGARVQHPGSDAAPAGDRPEDRRAGPDRRQAQAPFSDPDRRSGRDRRQRRFLRLLSEISKTLVDVLPLAQVLSRVVDLVFEVVPAERTFLLLRDSSDEAVTARVRRARDGSTPESTLSRTIINTVMRERVAMLADDARYDSRLGGAGSIHAMVNIRSFMCAPLWNRNEVIGVLYTDNPRSKRFVPEDLDVFAALANYAAVAIEQARVVEQLQIEMQKRERLARYHSPAVVNRILSGTESADAEFETAERDLSVMFTDLVGFTTRSEKLAPLEVSRLLNHFFARMAEQLFEFDGTLDKFIGDGILAVFGAPLPQPDHADRAIQAALGMRAELAEMNRELGLAPLQMRIALNSGVALTGDIGSPRRREFTVLGDVVNTCSRLESTVCRPGQIVCTRATLDRATKSFNTKSLGMVSLRGRESDVEVFEIS